MKGTGGKSRWREEAENTGVGRDEETGKQKRVGQSGDTQGTEEGQQANIHNIKNKNTLTKEILVTQ